MSRRFLRGGTVARWAPRWRATRLFARQALPPGRCACGTARPCARQIAAMGRGGGAPPSGPITVPADRRGGASGRSATLACLPWGSPAQQARRGGARRWRPERERPSGVHVSIIVSREREPARSGLPATRRGCWANVWATSQRPLAAPRRRCAPRTLFRRGRNGRKTSPLRGPSGASSRRFMQCRPLSLAASLAAGRAQSLVRARKGSRGRGAEAASPSPPPPACAVHERACPGRSRSQVSS
jgi:hypothetical protein